MQDANYDRLVNCFEQVFPGLRRDAIPQATHENLDTWDSVAQVTLLSLVGEQFSIDIDFEEYDEVTSFASILTVVRTKVAAVQS